MLIHVHIQVVAPHLVSAVKFGVVAPPNVDVTSAAVDHVLTFCRLSQMCAWSQSLFVSTLPSLREWEISTLQPIVQLTGQHNTLLYFGQTQYIGRDPAGGRAVSRGLLNAIVMNLAIRYNISSVYHAQWAARLCDPAGAVPCRDGGSAPASVPQEQVDILTYEAIQQPPWYVSNMYATTVTGNNIATVVPVSTDVADGWIDVAAVIQRHDPGCNSSCPCGMVLTFAQSSAKAQNVSVTLRGVAMQARCTARVTELSCVSASSINTANSSACHPATRTQPLVQGPAVWLTLAPHSVTTAAVTGLTCFV